MNQTRPTPAKCTDENIFLKAGKRTRIYGRMIKFEHTIFALPFALAALLLALRQSSVTWRQALWIVVAMAGARSAAMGFNRLADAHIDARNPRTAERDIPSGKMTMGETRAFVAVSSLVFIMAAFFLSWTCFWCSFLVLPVLFVYSYTKRFTSFSHLVLGFAIALAPMGVWVAITGGLSWRIAVLSLALCTYIGGFDILYSCQDIDFDKKEGLHSMPARMGASAAMHVSSMLHVISFLSLVSLYLIFNLTHVYLGFAAVIGILFIVEHLLVSPSNLSRINVAFFHVNSAISILLFIAMLTEEAMRRFA
jgi:4-hydroxybenzoate polyprenyltransferase